MNENDMGEYGQETDDWKMDDERVPFIDFGSSPGEVVINLTGRPKKQMSKYGKDQFHFPCRQLVDVEKKIWEDAIMSTSSNQIRKKLTKLIDQEPALMDGKHPIFVTWSGEGMSRVYSIGIVAEGAELLL